MNARQENTEEWTGLHICAKSPASVEGMTVRVANGADPNPEDGKGTRRWTVPQLDGRVAGRVVRATLVAAVQYSSYAIHALKAGAKLNQQTRWLEKAKNLMLTAARPCTRCAARRS